MTLDIDSPTISDWLDGRLPTDEADAVAAAVRATPKLEEAVAELRRVKQLLVEAGDQPVEPSSSLVSAVMAALEGQPPGHTDPFVDAADTRPPHDETDEQIREKVGDEWQHVERARVDQERAEAIEDEEAVREALRTEGKSVRSDRHWLKPALSVALAAGLVVAVLLNIGDQPPTDALPELAQQTLTADSLERPDIDPEALAERMIARGIELTTGRQSMGTLHMTVHLGDGEGRRQFEELLARSRVRLDREETMSGGRVERIGCLGRASEVDRLLETLAVSTGSVVLETGSLSREAIDRLERRGPVAEPMIAAADVEVEIATDPQPAPEMIAAAARPVAPQAMRAAAPPPAADSGAATPEIAATDAGSSLPGTAPPEALAQQTGALALRTAPEAAGLSGAAADTPKIAANARSAPGAGSGKPSMAAFVVMRTTDAPPEAVEPPPPPPQLIPPQGYVRLWIDIVDETKPAAATPGE